MLVRKTNKNPIVNPPALLLLLKTNLHLVESLVEMINWIIILPIFIIAAYRIMPPVKKDNLSNTFDIFSRILPGLIFVINSSFHRASRTYEIKIQKDNQWNSAKSLFWSNLRTRDWKCMR